MQHNIVDYRGPAPMTSRWQDAQRHRGWWDGSNIRGALFNPQPGAVPNVANKPRVRWPITVTVMDGIDTNEIIEPVMEAVNFVHRFSRFNIDLEIKESQLRHSLYSVTHPSGLTVYNMLRDQIPYELRFNLRVSNTFMFLYKLGLDDNGQQRLPLQYGSTMGVADGIPSPRFGTMSLSRPYATIATDTQGFSPNPYQGFTTQRAQITAHEFINTINCVLEVAPWYFPSMVGTSTWSSTYEAQRLLCLSDRHYNTLRQWVAGQE